MVNTTLVDTQIEDGERILRQLDADRFKVVSALWFFDTQKEKWILLIATPLVKTVGPRESYAKMKKSLDKLVQRLDTATLDVTLIKPEHDLLRALKSALRVGPGISRIRFTSTVINGKLIEDALVYRLG